MKKILILGFGGHASVVQEACVAAGLETVGFLAEEGLVASAPSPRGKLFLIKRNEKASLAKVGKHAVALGIGDNEARLWWCEKILQEGLPLPPIVHPRAWVSPSAILAEGVFVGPGAVVQAGAKISQAAIINSNATIEHHAGIGPGAHIGPGGVLAGLAKVGELSMIGAGAVVRDRVAVGKLCTVGAGAAVIQNVPDQSTVVGVPAKPISKNP